MKLFTRITLFTGLTLLFFACRKPTSAYWDTDVVVPVVNSKLNLKNFLSDTVIKSDNSGLLYIGINREVASVKLDSLFYLPDTTITQSFTVPAIFQLTLTPGQTLAFFPPSDLTFDIGNGALLKRVDVRSCILKAKFSNKLSQSLDLVYTIPSATKDGKAFTISETIPPGQASLIREYNLAGYSLDLKGATGTQFNTINQTYTLALNANAQPALVNFGDGATIEFSYSKVIPQFVEGYFGQQLINLPKDTVSFGISQNFTASNFMLNSVTMDFKILNEFGTEFSGSINNIKAINTSNNKVVTLNNNQLSTLNINRATRLGNTITPSVKPVSFNNSNSNAAAFISCLPDKLTYEGSINLNPLGNISSYNDFAYYNTGVKIMADINIPLKFSADYFSLVSNANVNFSDIKQLDNVKGGNFVIIASNGYPFDARLQTYMLNEQNQIIDSLFITGANTISRGQINSQNLVVAPTQSKIYIPVNAEKIANLKKCKHMRIVTKVLVPPGPPDVEIRENYEFDINVVAELTYKVATSGN